MLPVEFTPDHIFVKTPYEAREFVSQTLNGIWVKSKGMYRFPKNYQVMVELLEAFPQLRASPKFMELGHRLDSGRKRLLAIKAQEDIDGDHRLRPYQRVDVEYLAQLQCAGVFNEPRTGKTPTMIALIQRLKTQRNLVVCPASLIWNWTKEFIRWAPEIKVFTINGTPKKRAEIYQDFSLATGQKVLVISKDTWKADQPDMEFDLALVDEAHFLRALAGSKKSHSKQAEAIVQIKAERRYALTGTPTVKHTKDIYGILKFLYPTKFSSYWQFVERYFVMTEDVWTGAYVVGNIKPHRVEELQELIGFISVQRKRKEVMCWLPDKERIPFYVKMEGKQRKLYDQMVKDFMAVDDEVVVDTANVLTQLMRMRQLCLDPRLLGFDAPSAKTEALLEWLEDNPEPVVIMSMFTSYLKLLKPLIEELGIKVGMIHGEMANGEKDQSVADFQAGRSQVLLCNIISAGVGFTLDRADTIIFTDLAWNPADNDQAEDRITPTVEANLHKHTIITFQCQDSFDEAINGILQHKKTLTDVINEGGREAINRLLRG